MLLETHEDRSLVEQAAEAQWAALRAYRYGMFDVDEIVPLQERTGYGSTLQGFRTQYNFNPKPDHSFPSPLGEDDWSVTEGRLDSYVAQPNHLRGGYGDHLWIVVRQALTSGDEAEEAAARARARHLVEDMHTDILTAGADLR